MNQVIREAIRKINKGFERVEMFDQRRGERGFSTEIHEILHSVDELLEKYPAPSSATRRDEENDIANVLLLSMKIHRATLDIMYEIVEEITYIENRMGITKEKRREGFK